MKTKYYILLLVLIGGIVSSCNNAERKDSVENAEEINETNTSINEDTAEFMIKAASGGMMEVELGQTAEKNAQSGRVKEFGAMMVRDHSKANAELKALAQAKDITLPVTMGEDHQNHMNEMSKLQGAEFDVEYMEMMVDDHKDDIELFEKASKFKDQDISAFAAKTLPVLKAHLDSAQVIHDVVKREGKANK